ncbi:MAG TPA: tRNA lysidine(34) synthetase TilS [Bacteroidetes bacterium]|nr:tRNA lysidine(34) synthetase TilS [Bacteroidota bacterium]
MTEQFEQYRRLKQLFTRQEKILLAVSGGIDSVVMLDIFVNLKYNIAVAHCNFQLRGKESDGDEKFVESLCRKKGLRFFKNRFQTAEYACEKGISIQMAARELRYKWLNEIRKEESFDFVATGHNLNDSIETILINLTRGTGINGLTGISERSAYIIRPLLFASRKMITEYAEANMLEYREDSSNIQTKYTRNKIRHRVIPFLEQINPSVLDAIAETSDYLRSTYIIYEQAIKEKKTEITEYSDDSALINISSLKKLDPLETWIYEIFKEWNFGKRQLNDIIHLIDAGTGKQLFSASHVLTRDRDRIIISSSETREGNVTTINSAAEWRNIALIEKFEIIPRKNLKISDDPSYAYLDADLIQYPLTLRRWKDGDFFYPLGMKGRKKISDLLIDMKISLPDKDKVFVLEMNNKIIWVLGFRIDDRFKVTESTVEVMQILKRND